MSAYRPRRRPDMAYPMHYADDLVGLGWKGYARIVLMSVVFTFLAGLVLLCLSLV